MTKYEKIKEAYGECWDNLILNNQSNALSNNGYLPSGVFNYISCSIELEHTDEYSRPKSLQGIEDNNGWIKIESEDDLPKENNEYYWTITENDKDIKERWFNKFFNEYEGEGKVTHYQPIIKPKPPIY